jgi:hypothetical protein
MVCVCVLKEIVLFLNICYLEWLNKLVHFVVNGFYDKLFIENPNLRDLMNDDSHQNEILDKLNNDQELVGN